MWLDAGVAVEMALHVAVNEEAFTAHLARVPHVTSVLPSRWDQGFGSGLIITGYWVIIHFFPLKITFRVLLCLGSGSGYWNRIQRNLDPVKNTRSDRIRKPGYNNDHFVDSILIPQLSRSSKIRDLDHSTISSSPSQNVLFSSLPTWSLEIYSIRPHLFAEMFLSLMFHGLFCNVPVLKKLYVPDISNNYGVPSFSPLFVKYSRRFYFFFL